MYKGYLIDLDGVAYLGNKVIPTCRDFILKLNQENIKYCFVTNNSSRTTTEVCEHLNSIGYKVNEENIITSSEVTVNYLKKENKDAKVFLIGMTGIRTELEKNNFLIVDDSADYVVVGLDMHVNFAKLAAACQEILNGAKFISTNSDMRLLKDTGMVPGNGAICKLIEATTQVEPLYMGKPQLEMFEYGLEKLALNKEDVAMIGDNYFTDILGAHQFGISSIFVETGIMKKTDLENYTIKPTIMVKDLSELK